MEPNKCKICGTVIGVTIVIFATLSILKNICHDCEEKIGQHLPEKHVQYVQISEAPYAMSSGTSAYIVGVAPNDQNELA